MDSIDVLDFCYSLRTGELDHQLAALEKEAEEQMAYTSPLKPAFQAEERRAGEHKKKAVVMLKDLKQHLLSLYPNA